MSSYKLGSVGDRVVNVKNCDDEYVVTIKRTDSETKFIDLPPPYCNIAKHEALRQLRTALHEIIANATLALAAIKELSDM